MQGRGSLMLLYVDRQQSAGAAFGARRPPGNGFATCSATGLQVIRFNCRFLIYKVARRCRSCSPTDTLHMEAFASCKVLCKHKEWRW